MRVALDAEPEAALRHHAIAAYPCEACGLLGVASGGFLRRYIAVPNTAVAVDGFAMEPADFARAESELRRGGLALGAVFHSHPHRPPEPSAADRRGAWPGVLQLILEVWSASATGRVAAWLPCGGRFLAVPLRHATDTQVRGADQSIETSSISKINVASGGIDGGLPLAP